MQGGPGRTMWGLLVSALFLLNFPRVLASSGTPRQPQPQPNETISAAREWSRLLSSSLLFFDAQRSGPVEGNRVPWRQPSALLDGQDLGLNLSGGYFDAGDHVKYLFPLATVLTHLAWSGVDFADGFEKAGQLGVLRETVKYGCDFIVNSHFETGKLVVQVGTTGVDHGKWTWDETNLTMPRPSYFVENGRSGTDVVAQASAALAASSILFAKDSVDTGLPWATYPGYSELLLKHAKELWTMATGQRPYRKYQASVPDAANAYPSSGYSDELLYASLWLYRATLDPSFENYAKQFYDALDVEGKLKWTYPPLLDWDSKWGGIIVLSSIVFAERRYTSVAARYLDLLLPGKHEMTRGGLIWRDKVSDWQALGIAGNTAFLCMAFARRVGSVSAVRVGKLENFAVAQMRYLFGENPMNATYMVGVSENSPRRVHHAVACGPDKDGAGPNLHELTGAVINGPARNDGWSDDRSDYVHNEVAINTNALVIGTLAAFVAESVWERPRFGNWTLKEGENVLSGVDWMAVDSPEPFPVPVDVDIVAPQPVAEQDEEVAGLSGYAIAGIVVGSVLGAALLAGVGYAGYKEVKKRKEWKKLVEEGEEQGYDWSKFGGGGGSGSAGSKVGQMEEDEVPLVGLSHGDQGEGSTAIKGTKLGVLATTASGAATVAVPTARTSLETANSADTLQGSPLTEERVVALQPTYTQSNVPANQRAIQTSNYYQQGLGTSLVANNELDGEGDVDELDGIDGWEVPHYNDVMQLTRGFR